MRYCSSETRKVIECIEEYGIKLSEDEYFDVESVTSRFWNTHIQKTIVMTMTPSSKMSAEDKIERAQSLGWAYFEKPIVSMLATRGAAQRADDFFIPTDDDWTRKVYNIICTSYVVADFNMRELALLTLDLPPLVSDVSALSQYIDAARRGGSRNVYYLNGIAKREHETTQGKIRELQEARAQGSEGWMPDESIDEIDVVERMELERRWKQRLVDISISSALNDV